jgi:hypothetical protein
MMIEKIRIEMSDGSIWEMPALMIIVERADHYSLTNYPKEDNESFNIFWKREQVRKQEIEYGLSDNYELIDWVRNNHDFNDLVKYFDLTMIKAHDQVDYNKMFKTAEFDIVREVKNG